jgi:hypothetical protein
LQAEILRRRVSDLIKENSMSVPQVRALSAQVKDIRASLAKLVADAQSEMTSAVGEVMGEISNVRSEAAEYRKLAADLRGSDNGAPAGPLPGSEIPPAQPASSEASSSAPVAEIPTTAAVGTPLPPLASAPTWASHAPRRP